MKPVHEQEWSARPGRVGVERGVCRGNTLVLAATPSATWEDIVKAAAAPDMARALLKGMSPDASGRMHDDACPALASTSEWCSDACCDSHAVLREIGMLP